MSASQPPTPLASTRLLRTTLTWSAIVTAALAIVGAVIGYLVAGGSGLASALAGVILAAVFLGITAASILVANRWYGDDLYVPLFFGIVLGGWLLKLVVFVIVLMVLRHQPWIAPMVFFAAIVAGIVAALAIDVIVLVRMRVPTVDTRLPTDVEEGERTDDDAV